MAGVGLNCPSSTVRIENLLDDRSAGLIRGRKVQVIDGSVHAILHRDWLGHVCEARLQQAFAIRVNDTLIRHFGMNVSEKTFLAFVEFIRPECRMSVSLTRIANA